MCVPLLCDVRTTALLTGAVPERDGHQGRHHRHQRQEHVKPRRQPPGGLRLRHVDAGDAGGEGNGTHPEGPDASPL